MANTYTRLFVHVIIRVKRGHPKINSKFEADLYAYLGAVIRNQGHQPVKINGVANHVHLLIIQRPSACLSDLMREVKSESSRMINENGWVRGRFKWQVGFGAFSCDHHSIDKTVRYIEMQKEHHARGRSFREEYLKFLDDYGNKIDEQYIED